MRPADARREPAWDATASAAQSAASCTAEIEELPSEDIAGGKPALVIRPVRHDGANGGPYTIRRPGTRPPARGRIESSERTVYDCDEEFEDERVISRTRGGADHG